MIGVNHGAHVLRIESGRQGSRAHQIADHHGEVTALGLALLSWFSHGLGHRERGPAEFRDRRQYLPPMPKRDPELFEVLIGQVAQDREIDIILGEALGVCSQTDRIEPDCGLLHHRDR